MASESSFDIVSKVDKQEVSNALHQAQKEISQRYDFRGVGAEIDYSGDKILIKANAEERALAVLDVFQSKLVKRGISLKSLDSGKPYASGKETRIECFIKEGIAQDQAKKISKMIREEGPKGVKANIQGDELRVSSKSRDDLQEVIAMLKSADLEVDLQFVNYR
ncbi:YajQ family cyclic di-GMP-binding protein [Rothia sp. (in: high G+C Gram-positive bacteria)]|uniref:YajQ family cyclic di-GMP-binding protein n=1 Tax=Rothia sp. (in: high G+C Gram-positive bacteria) TaxID=1885016 RepID=UPI001CAE8D10|nr:YajQ family cyclic di-GMP-binding protein [Rothia sp. (in: high G+C Gram-positive bacteria)]MBF1655944.1 YajQ family cyclic di-GMP-binding protein [Rothia sp. (in: high G+C Gram-positive bacteria)]